MCLASFHDQRVRLPSWCSVKDASNPAAASCLPAATDCARSNSRANKAPEQAVR